MKLVHYIAIAGLSAMMLGLPVAHADSSMDTTVSDSDQSGDGTDQSVSMTDDSGDASTVAPNCTVGSGGAC